MIGIFELFPLKYVIRICEKQRKKQKYILHYLNIKYIVDLKKLSVLYITDLSTSYNVKIETLQLQPKN